MNIVIQQVDIVDGAAGERFHILCEVQRDGQPPEMQLYVTPTDVLEGIAATYDMDSADTDALLEVLLYRPHLPPVQDVFTAGSIAEARESLLTHIAEVKGEGGVTGMLGESELKPTTPDTPVVASSGVDDPVAFLKAEADVDEMHLRVKREYIRQTRDRVRDERVARRAARRQRRAGSERRERQDAYTLRNQLLGEPTDPRQPPVSAGRKPRVRE